MFYTRRVHLLEDQLEGHRAGPQAGEVDPKGALKLGPSGLISRGPWGVF